MRPRKTKIKGVGGIYANYSKRKKGSNNSLKTVARGIKSNIIEIWIKKTVNKAKSKICEEEGGIRWRKCPFGLVVSKIQF